MPGARVGNAPRPADRICDISSWQVGDISSMSSRQKKRYNRRKSAVKEYFTTDANLDEIAFRHHLSAAVLLKLVEKCLMQHEDGILWGFRALLPGIKVIDHAPRPAPEEAVLPNEEGVEPDKEGSDATIEELPVADEAGMPVEDEQPTKSIEEVSLKVEAHEEVGIEDEDILTRDVEVEQVRPRARLTMPIPVVAVESDGHNVTALTPLALPTSPKKQVYVALTKKAAQRRLIRKYRRREAQAKHKQRGFQLMLILAVLAALVLMVLVPTSAGLAAYSTYGNISTLAHDGANHLLKVKSLLEVSKTDPTAVLNATRLQQSQVEFTAAESDFTQLQKLVSRPDVQSAITQFAPQYSNKLAMAQSLIQAALDVSNMGKELCGVALLGADIVHSSPLATGSTKPLISTSDALAIEGSLVHALSYIGDIRLQLSRVSIKDLPISDAQKAQITSALLLLPKAEEMITQGQSLIGPIFWLLGVGQPRRFLIQTMDRAELRPGGGFTGQYGVLQIQDGRMSHVSLTDITLLDYAGNGTAIGRKAPRDYSWMDFPNWGVRDSNLSGDFPTTARMTMQVFQDEGGGPVDGDIAFTPTLIGHIIDITGPIKVPGYDETITSKNLEERLHYYQQDFSAIAREKQISGNYSHSGRKAFTSTLGQLLLDRVRHFPVSKLIEVVKVAIRDLQSRDLEMYFTHPTVEAWLAEHGYSASVDSFSKQDGFMVVQGNFSISKASQYVHTTEHDDVMLDAQGNAIHNLTITLDYQQKGPVYGYDTYADYIRVYAPRSATLISGDGFDSRQPLCSPGPIGSMSSTSGCGQYNSYFPSHGRYCPDGNYSLGIEWGTVPWKIDSLGPPTELTSDLPGRAMWGGLTLTPKNCISYITLSWSVPHTVQKVNGLPSYAMLIQKQSGLTPTIELTIDASAIKGLKSFKFTGDITADKSFSLVPPKKK